MILESRAEVEDTLPAYVISWEAQLWRQLDFLMSIVEVSGSSQLFHECLEIRNRAFILLILIIAPSVMVLGLTTVMASVFEQFVGHGHLKVMSHSRLW